MKKKQNFDSSGCAAGGTIIPRIYYGYGRIKMKPHVQFYTFICPGLTRYALRVHGRVQNHDSITFKKQIYLRKL